MYSVHARLVGTVVVTLALASGCNSNDKPAEPTDVNAQKLNWSDCGGGFQCSTAKVPVDYAKPSGTFTLSLIRLPATDKAHRIGSLLTNPGGPGGSGVEFVRSSARAFGTDIRARFDIVGFDPRGVGKSDPVRCNTTAQLDDFFATDASPDDPQEVNTLVAKSKNFADTCKSKSQELPYVGTTSAAHDMDVLRAALGDKKITYYGASYGTYLGASYAEQFPQNIRAFVLDGAVDPKESSTETLVEQSKGFETALKAFSADCVQRSDCPLGKTTDEALAKVTAFQKQVDAQPLTNTRDSRKVTESWATMGIALPLYVKTLWPALRQALSKAINEHDGTQLLFLADQLVERDVDGTYSNQTDANMAVNCVDKPNPDLQTYEKSVNEAAKQSPHFGPFVVWGGLPCVYWPVQTHQQPHPITAKGSAPILVIGTLRDPATPYKWAQSLASQLENGRLLSLDGDGHTAYLQGNSCITEATDRYLTTGEPPKDGTLCH